MADLRQDYLDLRQIKYRCLRVLPYTSSISVLAIFTYFGYRTKTILDYSRLDDQDRTSLYSALYLLVEIGISLPNLLNHFLRCLAASTRIPKHNTFLNLLDDPNPPSIDIFVTCAGEDPDLVINTIEAAAASDYPASRFRVIVLDDDGSGELAEKVAKLKRNRSNVYYTARNKGKDHHFKAGNLNHGYQFVKGLEGGAAPFIASLDADMIPNPKWLRALMPYLLQDSKLALIQPPQRFYDVPTPDHLLQGLDVNYRVIEPLREIMSSTWCGGSGYIVRRLALDSIDGFPTGSIGEDMYCSNVLLGKGWKTKHVDESLQAGRVPDTYKAHVQQQSRWHVGRVQTAAAMRFYLFGHKSRRLNMRQRCVGLIAACLSLTNITTSIALMILVPIMFSGRPLIVSRDRNSFRRLILMTCSCVVCEWLDNCIISLITGYRIAMSECHTLYWAAPYHAAALVKAFASQFLPSGGFGFVVSGSSSEPTDKSDAESKSLIMSRLLDVWKNKAWTHLLYITLLSVGIVQNVVIVLQHARSTHEQRAWGHAALVYLGWPPLVWMSCLSSMTVPLMYMLLPPTIPNREEMLKRDPMLRASYPRERDDTLKVPFYLREDILYTVSVLYTLVVTSLSRRYL